MRENGREPGRRRLEGKGRLAHAYVIDHDDRASQLSERDGCKDACEQGDCLPLRVVAFAQEDQTWSLSVRHRKQSREVQIGGHEHTEVLARSLQDHVVVCPRQPQGGGMSRIVSLEGQPLCQLGDSGISTRNLPRDEFDRFVFGEAGGILEGFVDVLRFEVGIGLTDGGFGFAGSQQPEQPGYGEAESPDARFSCTDVRVNRDARQVHASPIR